MELSRLDRLDTKSCHSPQITMFIGLDTAGEVYLSLLQSNSNNRTMEIFLRQLVLKLDKEDQNWRANTVILHDNAPYATSESTLEIMEGLRIPMLFSGPYSYDASPIELLYAAFKSDDANLDMYLWAKGKYIIILNSFSF